MRFHYFLFPHRADQLKAKEDADEGLHRVEDKDCGPERMPVRIQGTVNCSVACSQAAD